jgi:serine/threonine-protein kinase RsbT
MSGEFSIAVASPWDVEQARRHTRLVARALGFREADAEAVILSVSELATNLVRYALEGRIVVRSVSDGARTGIVVESVGAGPGIPNVERALTDGFSTGNGLGSGLAGVRRLMDDFDISSGPGGTHISARKWL